MNDHPADLIPTEANHFKVHYTPWIGLTLLAIGILTVFLILLPMLLEGIFNSAIIIGVVCIVAGYLYCTRPYFAIAPNRLTLYNLIGSTVKRYPFPDFNHLNIENDRLYIETAASGTGHEKVKITKWMVKSTDWKKLEELISISRT
ncbi:MAG: hypothetical protein ACFB16_02270 [Phormidesmis sp.]